jgi:CDP-glucose 4,6-dehydratase
MGLTLFGNRYKGTRVLITGHTGFKGAWLALWLHHLGAVVKGVSLPDEDLQWPNHWGQLNLNDVVDTRSDIRQLDKLKSTVQQFSPQVVFHLAAQSLVRRGYADPITNWSSNVMGTANILEVCRQCPAVKAVVVITTDKCYENREWLWGYRENDALGGHDPYSASKAAVEILVASYRRSFFSNEGAPLIATARAGNVIGGGDWSEDRLLPDIMKSQLEGTAAKIRSPYATRPWQHVLESLSGYLLLGQRLLENDHTIADAWNFGPGNQGNCQVIDVLHQLQEVWPELEWTVEENSGPHEATLLQLDCTKARHHLDWHSVWGLKEGIHQTAKWYKAWSKDQTVISEYQLKDYILAAKSLGLVWCQQ